MDYPHSVMHGVLLLLVLTRARARTTPREPRAKISSQLRTRMLAAASSLTLGLRAPAALRSPPARMDLAAAAGVSQLQLDQDRAIASRAEKERSLLRLEAALPLEALVQKGVRVDSGGGFGAATAKKSTKKTAKKGAAKSKAPAMQPPRSVLGKELQKNGVVRVNGALSHATADALREFVDAERLRASAEVEEGRRRSDERFANLVLLSNRCDLLLPLDGPPVDAMAELLGEGSVLGPLLEEVVGRDAVFNELACLISEPGSLQQPLHPDTPYTPRPPLYAAFVALQDVDVEMGPTIYLPGTHTKEEHTAFYGGNLDVGRDHTGHRTNRINEDYIASKPVRLGLLSKGDVALYNQQVLHCGGANESPGRVRRQFYFSVRDFSVPGVQARPSIRPAFLQKLTLGEVRDELVHVAAGRGSEQFAALHAKDTTEQTPRA